MTAVGVGTGAGIAVPVTINVAIAGVLATPAELTQVIPKVYVPG